MEACMLSPNANRETKLLRDFGEDQFLFTKRSGRRDREGCNGCSTGRGLREIACLIEEIKLPSDVFLETVRRVPAVCGQHVVSASDGAVGSRPLVLMHQAVARVGQGSDLRGQFLVLGE